MHFNRTDRSFLIGYIAQECERVIGESFHLASSVCMRQGAVRRLPWSLNLRCSAIVAVHFAVLTDGDICVTVLTKCTSNSRFCVMCVALKLLLLPGGW